MGSELMILLGYFCIYLFVVFPNLCSSFPGVNTICYWYDKGRLLPYARGFHRIESRRNNEEIEDAL